MTKIFMGSDYRLVFDEDGQPDMDTTFAEETNPAQVLLADLFKIITCAAGTLWWAPTATEDVTQARNDAMTDARRVAFASRIQGAVEQDSRYSEVEVAVAQVGTALRVVISATTVARQLRLILVAQEDGTLRVEEASVGNV